jgi:hypothetical protein
MDREEHGKLRAGKITGTLAHTIMYGGADAWATAIKNLWADTGETFARTGGIEACAHGIEYEGVGAAKFWERHPEYEMEHEPYYNYTGALMELRGYVGTSPDRVLYDDKGYRRAGLEVKSPTEENKIIQHLPKNPADMRSNPHFAQCQHGMLVLDVPRWYQVVHFEDQYFELIMDVDTLWLSRYLPRLRDFIRQYEGGNPAPRRKLRVTDDD